MARPRRDLGSLATGFGEAGLYFPSGTSTRPRIWRTGIDPVDVATGVGGIPESRIVVVHGPQSAGKTTLVGHLAAEVINAGGFTVYMDHERKLDQDYYARIGVDFSTRRFIIARPRHIEEGMALIENFGKKVRQEWGEADIPILVVWDSIHAIPAKKRFEKGFEEGNFSPEAAAYNDGFKKVAAMISDNRMMAMFISQIRLGLGGFIAKDKIGIGNAVGHAASIILQFQAPKALGKPGAGRTGNLCRLIVPKNQVAAPWTHTEFPLHFNENEDHPAGIDMAVCAMTAAKMVGVAQKNGTIEIGGEEGDFVVRGLPALRRMMTSAPEQFDLLRKLIVAKTLSAQLHRLGEGGEEETDEEVMERAARVLEAAGDLDPTAEDPTDEQP